MPVLGEDEEEEKAPQFGAAELSVERTGGELEEEGVGIGIMVGEGRADERSGTVDIRVAPRPLGRPVESGSGVRGAGVRAAEYRMVARESEELQIEV